MQSLLPLLMNLASRAGTLFQSCRRSGTQMARATVVNPNGPSAGEKLWKAQVTATASIEPLTTPTMLRTGVITLLICCSLLTLLCIMRMQTRNESFF